MPGFADDIGKLTPHLRRFARALVRGHAVQAADDLVQETVVLASRSDHTRCGTALTVWCFAALIRSNRLRNRAPLADARDPAAATPLPFLPKDMLRLDALPLESREVLLLVALAGLAYGHVAEILDVDVGTALSRLTRARDLLARADGASGTRSASAGERAKHAGATTHLRLVK